jgi:methyl-accepting chemotaxis protein
MFFGMWLQDPGSLSSGNSRLLMFFVALVAVAMVVQAIVVILIAVGAAKARKELLSIAQDLRAKALPVVEGTRSMLHEMQPKIRVVTENLVETSHIVRAKAAEIDTTISDVNVRARAQSARVDEMVTSVLDATEGIASTLQKSVSVPVREFHGLMNGLKAGFDVLTGRRMAPHRLTPDKDGSVSGSSPFASAARPFGDGEPRV